MKDGTAFGPQLARYLMTSAQSHGSLAHGGVDVALSGDELGDVWGHPVHDRVGEEQPAEVVEGVAQCASGGVLDAERGQRVVEVAAQRTLGFPVGGAIGTAVAWVGCRRVRSCRRGPRGERGVGCRGFWR